MYCSGENRIPRFKRLSDEQAFGLEILSCLEEIKEAVMSCGGDKAPGPNGFTFTFIKQYSELIKLDIHAFVSDFFSKARIPSDAILLSLL